MWLWLAEHSQKGPHVRGTHHWVDTLLCGEPVGRALQSRTTQEILYNSTWLAVDLLNVTQKAIFFSTKKKSKLWIKVCLELHLTRIKTVLWKWILILLSSLENGMINSRGCMCFLSPLGCFHLVRPNQSWPTAHAPQKAACTARSGADCWLLQAQALARQWLCNSTLGKPIMNCIAFYDYVNLTSKM